MIKIIDLTTFYSEDIVKNTEEILGDEDLPSSAELDALMSEYYLEHKEMYELYERYKGEAPIFDRVFEDPNKVNNQLGNDFFGEIIDTKVGYLAGKPINYNIDEDEPQKDEIETKINRLRRLNNLHDLNREAIKIAAITGKAARLLYIDKEGYYRIKNVKPWQVITIGDKPHEPKASLRYYQIKKLEDGEIVYRTRIEYYTSEIIVYYIEDADGNYTPDPNKPPQPHMFKKVPLFEMINNEEKQGDAEKVLNLIDAYDRSMSDLNSEIEQYRIAYMIFMGLDPDPETVKEAKEKGGFSIPDGEGDIKFLTKDLPSETIEKHLDRLENNILRFANSVNFGDEEFAGNQSGVSLKYKLFGLETKSSSTEAKFNQAFMYQFRVLATAWEAENVRFSPIDNLSFNWTRNLPANIADEAKQTDLLKGNIPEKTRLSQLSFIEDPDKAYEQLMEDRRREAEIQQEYGVDNNQNEQNQENQEQEDSEES